VPAVLSGPDHGAFGAHSRELAFPALRMFAGFDINGPGRASIAMPQIIHRPVFLL
jgi:hypothetical protein